MRIQKNHSGLEKKIHSLQKSLAQDDRISKMKNHNNIHKPRNMQANDNYQEKGSNGNLEHLIYLDIQCKGNHNLTAQE